MSPVHCEGDEGGRVYIYFSPQLYFKHCYVLNAFRVCFYILPEIFSRRILVMFFTDRILHDQSEFLRQSKQSGQWMDRDCVKFYTVESSQYVFLISFPLNLSVFIKFHSLLSYVTKIEKGFTAIYTCALSKRSKLPSPARICSPVTKSAHMAWEGKMAEFVQGEDELSDSEEGLLRAMAQLQLRREKKLLPIVYEKNETHNPAQTKSSVACQCWIGVEQLAFYGPPGASLQLPSMTSPGSLMSASVYPVEEEGASISTPPSRPQPMDTDDQPAKKKWKPESTIKAPEVESASPAPNQETPATQNESPTANETASAKKPRRRWPQGRRKALAKQRAEAAAAAEAATPQVESPLQHPNKKAKKQFNSSLNSSSAKPFKPAMKSVVAQNTAKGGGQQQIQQPSRQQQQPSQQQQLPEKQFMAQGAKPKINRQNFKPDARRKINRKKEKRYADGSLIPPMTAEEIRIRDEEWRRFRLTGVDNQAPRNIDYRLSDPNFPRVVDNAAMNPPVVPLDGRNRDVKHAAYVMAEQVKQERARAANVVASPLEPANYVMPPLERIVVYEQPPQPIPQQLPQPQPLPFPELLRAMAAQLEATQKK